MYFNGKGRLAMAFVFLFGTGGVLAAGTTAGTDVTNSVTLDYQVNSIDQTQLTTSVSFEVDRALSVVVSTADADVVNVAPGETNVLLSFDVTNTSNDDMDLLLGVVDQNATAVAGFTNAGPGVFDGTSVKLVLDVNANGVYDVVGDTDLVVAANHYSLPSGDTVPDTPVRIFLVADVPLTAVNADQATYSLVAAVANGVNVIQGDTNGHITLGGVATDVVDDITLVQDIFADNVLTSAEDGSYNFVTSTASAVQDIVSNGQHSDSAAFVVSSAALTIEKVVQVIWDPINGYHFAGDNDDTPSTNNPKAIPGSILMYVVGVQNGAGANAATDVQIMDDLSEDLVEGIGTTTEIPAAILKPDNVTFAGLGLIDVPNAADASQLTIRDCAGVVITAPFIVGDPEVSRNIGTCTAGQTGIIVYFVTVK